jgi:hypothetical protein
VRLTLSHDDGTQIASVKVGASRWVEATHDSREAMLLLRELEQRIPDRNPFAVPRVTTHRMTVLINRNLTMTPGKTAAQAVHAALRWYGIQQGAVVVLNATPTQIRRDCDVTTTDAGRTEVPAGSLTAGIRRDSDR